MIKHLYLHIPFCLKKCGYCSFFSVPFTVAEKRKYLDYLIIEINRYLDNLVIKPETIYFGGGTPSLLEAEEIESVLNCFDLSELTELTIEVNPGTVDQKKVAEYSQLPITRVSIGAQSFVDEELKSLGRCHTKIDTLDCFDLLRDYEFENISLDLIYGLESQTMEKLDISVTNILALAPEHISLYCLTLDENTPLRNRYRLPDDETVSKFYRYLRKTFVQMGYEHYEISNFAVKGAMAKHNLAYWKLKNYCGFGAGAHSYAQGKRYSNYDNLVSYYRSVENGELFPNAELLDIKNLHNDYLIQHFRLLTGVGLRDYQKLFSENFVDKYNVQIKKLRKHLNLEEDMISIKPSSLFVSNEIISEFLD